MPTNNAINSTSPLLVSRGGTGAVSFTSSSLLLGQGTNAITALGAATNGQIPIGSTGVDPVLNTITAGTGISVSNGAGSITISSNLTVGKVLIQSQTASSSTDIRFTSGITGYTYYFMEILNMIPATDATHLYLQFSTDGGSTWANTAYSNVLTSLDTNSVTNNSVGDSNSQIEISHNISNSTSSSLSGTWQFFSLGNSSQYKKIMGNSVYYDTGPYTAYTNLSSAWKDTSNAVNGLKFSMSSGNINSGTFRLFGIV